MLPKFAQIVNRLYAFIYETKHSKSGLGLPSIVALVMTIDKSWTTISNRNSDAFLDGLFAFIKHCEPLLHPITRKIRCPCSRCCNRDDNFVTLKTLEVHKSSHGFDQHYTTWKYHDEPTLPLPPPVPHSSEHIDMDAFFEDISANNVPTPPTQTTGPQPAQTTGPNNEFEELLSRSTQKLYPGCDMTTLEFTTEISHIKALHKITDKKSRRKQRKDSAPTEPTTKETPDDAHSRVLALETTKSTQALEIESLKRRLKSLEKRRKSRTPGFKRLRKEDASKLRRKITDLDADAEVTLEKDVAKKEVSAADLVTTAGEVVTTANVEVTTVKAPITTIDEFTLAQTLIEIKASKPKAVTSAATTTITTRPKAKGVVVQELSEFKTTSSSLQASQLPQAKDKGKGITVEPKVPLKKKDQVALGEEMARNLEAQLQAELIEEERLARQKEEEANIALPESWDNTQAMMDDDFQLTQQMKTEEQEQLSIK
ncbi:ribonuclease H-like domain-containing protein [Tanacetum coccineum]